MRLEVTGAGPLYMHQLAPEGPGSVIEGPDGTAVTYEGTWEYRAADIPSVSEFLITVVGQVSAAMIAAGLIDWLQTNFRGHSTQVTINRRIIDLDEAGRAVRVIEEVITEETRG